MNSEPISINITSKLPKWAKALFKPSRYKVPHGGRGAGAKSWTVARVLLQLGTKKTLRVLCARETQQSIKESVHQLLSSQIKKLGLEKFYTVNNNSIVGVNGTEFIFTGLRVDPDKMKSYEDIDTCWVEEAHNVSKQSWKTLIPTIRKPGSEIWVTFNPRNPDDPTSDMFLEHPRPGALVIKLSQTDNPYFTEEMRSEMEYDYTVDPEAAAHVWGGAYQKVSKAQIFGAITRPDGVRVPKYVVESFEVPYLNQRTGKPWDASARPDDTKVPAWFGPYFGADWGFSVDPDTLVKLWISGDKKKLYLEYEAYKVGVELNDIPKLWDQVPGSRTHVIRADNARPETISHVSGLGYAVVPCEKWSGCVEDGIRFLRSFEQIVIHPRCVHAETEARLYSYKVDALTGEVLPIIVDKHNHIWDAIRYALEQLFRKSTEEMVVVSEYDSTQHQTMSDLDLFELRLSMMG